MIAAVARSDRNEPIVPVATPSTRRITDETRFRVEDLASGRPVLLHGNAAFAVLMECNDEIANDLRDAEPNVGQAVVLVDHNVRCTRMSE